MIQKQINDKLNGKIAGIYTRTQGVNVHNAKVEKVTDKSVTIYDLNRKQNFTYRKGSVIAVNCG